MRQPKQRGTGSLLLPIAAAHCSGTLQDQHFQAKLDLYFPLMCHWLLVLTSSMLPITSALLPLPSDRITKAHSGVSWLNKI